jgi:methyl-accepting chemotaxis protein
MMIHGSRGLISGRYCTPARIKKKECGHEHETVNLSNSSLGIKPLVLVATLTITLFTILFLVNSHWQRSNTLSQIDHLGQRVSDLLYMITEGLMLIGDDQGTQEKFQKSSSYTPI